jgi:hypothetical protein
VAVYSPPPIDYLQVMRSVVRFTLVIGLLAAVAAAALGYRNREELGRQWASYRVGAAADVDEARARLAWFETPDDSAGKLHNLVHRWGTGNQRFDFYLAWHVHDPQCSEAFLEAFSQELAEQPKLLDRWTHFWLWRAAEEPDREIRQTLFYLGNVAKVQPPKSLTWREVLDLEAIFHVVGHDPLAERLRPDKWQKQFFRWSQVARGQLPHVARPELPFPDWTGPVPPKR